MTRLINVNEKRYNHVYYVSRKWVDYYPKFQFAELLTDAIISENLIVNRISHYS
ncbi:hypothetical protein [Clostridium beijerinckii]|uniref:hypothetical protein n=1 Tax=Clostridium beijerinckii TaxID=1520 RepID=UPI00156DDF8F|nr:hypothetical protein [Clostridium beijerinckii]